MLTTTSKFSFSLLHVDHVKLDLHWDYENVISPYYRLYYIDEGSGHISTEHEKVILEPGFIYIIPSFTLCNLHCSSFLSQYFIQFFEESADGISLFGNRHTVVKVKASETDIVNFKKLLKINPGRGINRSDDPKIYEKTIFYKEYQELNKKQNVAVYLETQGILMQLLSRFINDTHMADSSDVVPSKILETIRYIQLNIAEQLTVTMLAKRVNQQKDYFSRLFLRTTGQRPMSYIHGKRIERAQYLMITTNKTFSEISGETGFEGLPHFTRIFKKITTLTPSQYRQQSHFR